MSDKIINKDFEKFDLAFYDLNDLDFCVLAAVCGCCIDEVCDKYPLPFDRFGYYDNILELMKVLGATVKRDVLIDIIRILESIDLICPLSDGIVPKRKNNTVVYRPMWGNIAHMGVSNKTIKELFKIGKE